MGPNIGRTVRSNVQRGPGPGSWCRTGTCWVSQAPFNSKFLSEGLLQALKFLLLRCFAHPLAVCITTVFPYSQGSSAPESGYFKCLKTVVRVLVWRV
jgi:hypothetical protein